MTEARKLTEALCGKWHATYGTAPCPVCQPEGRLDQNALTVTDGRRGLLLSCKKSKCRFSDILSAAKIPPRRRLQSAPVEQPRQPLGTNSGFAKKLWEASAPIAGTVAEKYLRRARRLDLPTMPTLRFNLNTWHAPTRGNLPAMIAPIEGADAFAISRTFLRYDGSGKADVPAHQQRLMLGAAAGGHVSLKPGNDILFVAEGIETALSLSVLNMVGDATLWAALSSANMHSLRLPDEPGQLVIATDGDEAGRAAGNALANKAVGLGWEVEFRPAPEGRDWNDVLVERLATAGGCKHVV